ncbi:MAG TPA: sigma-70 family RNA polymerase sigma factor [Polyangiaceae bacterium]|nr:sigma-70 family RNA polymerase sigma factor [Polyangiaceae bacterium]
MRPKPLAAATSPSSDLAPTEARIARLAPAPLDFERVYEAEFDFVWRSLLLLGVAPGAVEDATQDVFSVVSRRLGSFEGRSALRTWLFAILQRVAANQRRSVRRKQRQLEPLEDAVSQLPTPHAQIEAAESIDRVQRFCDTLAPDWRAVFVLALLEELPAPEVSQALGIPVNTVYSRVRQLREGLRRMLAEEEVKHGGL